MKKLKLMTCAFSVMALICFANSATAEASFVSKKNATAFCVSQLNQIATTVIVPAHGVEILTLNLPADTDVKSKAFNPSSATYNIVSIATNETQDVNGVGRDIDLRIFNNQLFNYGIAKGKPLLLQFQ